MSNTLLIGLLLPVILQTCSTQDKFNQVVHFQNSSDIVIPLDSHLATIFFLHGQGGSGSSMRSWVKAIRAGNYRIPHIKMVFPTGPMRPYSLFELDARNAWYDRKTDQVDELENLSSMKLSINGLSDLIREEVYNGIPLNKIAIGGISIGGTIAMHMAYKYFPDIAGVFALASFLPTNSTVYQHIKDNPRRYPDTFISANVLANGSRWGWPEWSEQTARDLQVLGINVTLHMDEEYRRPFGPPQLDELYPWLNHVLDLNI